MKEPVIVEPYNDNWPSLFNELRNQIIKQIGPYINRVDHIGSTSVVGLAAKPIVDIQISVSDFEHMEPIRTGLAALGYQYRSDNGDLTKRYFRESSGMRRTHIHIRQSGSWSEQFNLLFRDYLREHEEAKNQYATVKNKLAKQYRNDREQYVEAKTEIIWDIITPVGMVSEQPSKIENNLEVQIE